LFTFKLVASNGRRSSLLDLDMLPAFIPKDAFKVINLALGFLINEAIAVRVRVRVIFAVAS
jgi:hypothetical protein